MTSAKSSVENLKNKLFVDFFVLLAAFGDRESMAYFFLTEIGPQSFDLTTTDFIWYGAHRKARQSGVLQLVLENTLDRLAKTLSFHKSQIDEAGELVNPREYHLQDAIRSGCYKFLVVSKDYYIGLRIPDGLELLELSDFINLN